MGEAKRRGSLEKRAAQANARAAVAMEYAEACQRAAERMKAANERQTRRAHEVRQKFSGAVVVVRSRPASSRLRLAAGFALLGAIGALNSDPRRRG